MMSPEPLSEFLQYLALNSHKNNGDFPTLAVLSQELGISIASLREQMEVARALGLIEVRPRVGIRPQPYTFKPAVTRSVKFALSQNSGLFYEFSDLRGHIEMAYWYQAVALLKQEDLDTLKALVERAKAKLHGQPVQIPHEEHRELHLTIYRRLNNPFVLGILESYWELYEEVGLNLYNDYGYLERVWDYHQRMVNALCKGDFAAFYQAIMEHLKLINLRARGGANQRFE